MKQTKKKAGAGDAGAGGRKGAGAGARGGGSTLSLLVILVVPITCAILAALVLNNNKAADSQQHATTSISDDDLLSFSLFPGAPLADKPGRVAVGLNSCVDLIVPALEVFKSLSLLGDGIEAKDHDQISSLKELQETFRFFFQQGGAGERFVASASVMDRIVGSAKLLESGRLFVGGNAALMGLTIKSMDDSVEVLMGGGVGPKLQDLLKQKMSFPSGSLLSADDYHVILEYPKGATWANVTAPRANRFIISHDQTNSQMRTLEEFSSSMNDFGPDAVVLSGVHMLEGEAESFRSSRLDDFVDMLKAIPKHTPIHFELASMASVDFVGEIVKKVFPYVDSIGLNEQELQLVARAANGPYKDLVTNGHADTGLVGETIYWLLKTFAGQDNESRLSRVHFHSLTFHIIAHTANSWTNTKKATVAGSWACTRRACGGSNKTVTVQEVSRMLPSSFSISSSTQMELKSSTPAVGWTRANIDFFLAPVYVCHNPGSTVGLGDTISATGLFYSKFVG
mmetsp:Transcript_9104/g.16676  ORF Transcript_9104/g.16676 Transcript_9104/m.16676 type:complete len:511 (+) Transcript_9104:245-1777(+)